MNFLTAVGVRQKLVEVERRGLDGSPTSKYINTGYWEKCRVFMAYAKSSSLSTGR